MVIVSVDSDFFSSKYNYLYYGICFICSGEFLLFSVLSWAQCSQCCLWIGELDLGDYGKYFSFFILKYLESISNVAFVTSLIFLIQFVIQIYIYSYFKLS